MGCYFWNVHHGVLEGCRGERITWYLADELRRLMVVTYGVQLVHIRVLLCILIAVDLG